MSSKTIENKLARIIYFTYSCEADVLYSFYQFYKVSSWKEIELLSQIILHLILSKFSERLTRLQKDILMKQI